MSILLGKLKDVMFWIDQINQDRMGKMEGTFLHRGKNELQQAIVELEREEHEKFFGYSPFNSIDGDL
jgi:hypothetical protein